jgi:tetratricopeptide (TPR) repeat protein
MTCLRHRVCPSLFVRVGLQAFLIGLSCFQILLATTLQKVADTREETNTALELAQKGDLRKAESRLRRLVELAPDDPFALSALGTVLGMQQKLAESSAYLERALKIEPDDLATRRNLASNQFQLGQLELAKENLQRLLQARPADPTTRLLMGMVAEELKDYGTAVKLLSSVPEQVREQPKAVAALARAYYRTGQKQRGRETLKQLQRYPFGAEGIFLGGQVAAQSSDFETAEQLFASIRATYPDSSRLGYQLAWVQYQANRIQESQQTLNDLIEAGRTSSQIYNLLSWCLHKQNKFKDAVAAMDHAIELDPSAEGNYLDLGMILLAHKRLPVALEAAKKAVEVAPRSYQAAMLKGLVEAKMNRLIEAADSYARAIELDPAAPEAFLALALVLSADGKAEEAEAAFKRAIDQFPGNATLFQEYGKMLLKFGEGGDSSAQARAISMFQTALKLNGALAESHYQLGNLALSNNGKTEEALPHLETAAKLNFKSSKVHFALARAYRRLGRSEAASKETRIYENLKAEEDKAPAESDLATGPSHSAPPGELGLPANQTK